MERVCPWGWVRPWGLRSQLCLAGYWWPPQTHTAIAALPRWTISFLTPWASISPSFLTLPGPGASSHLTRVWHRALAQQMKQGQQPGNVRGRANDLRPKGHKHSHGRQSKRLVLGSAPDTVWEWGRSVWSLGQLILTRSHGKGTP